MKTEIIDGHFAFTVVAAGQTSVKKLLEKNGVSHRLFQRLLADGALRIGAHETVNKPIGKGTRVTFLLPSSDHVQKSSGELTVVSERENWLIIDKPAGLTSVPGPANPDDSVLNRVAFLLEKRGIKGPQPAIITRLDRDTRGLMLVAKHPFAQGVLDASPEAALKKSYRAIVAGRLEPASGTINLPIGRAEDGVHRMIREDGQAAWTDYETETSGEHYSELRLTLHTGRTHQIRVHLASLGHPLVGDSLYGGEQTKAGVQLLQAFSLDFTDPFDQETAHYELDYPKDWPVL